ncbi:TRAP transporter large permease [Oleispirillum naphthae]|uniref:TRAP transporter large permease n=1 Tax=Oleispirillum naphthae TaxID=2838853 RepID=UPI0030823639
MDLDFTTVGAVAIAALLFLLGMGLPIGIDFLLVGACGVALLLGPEAMVSLAGETMYSAIASPTFCVLPLFILMGAFAARGGFAERAYRSIHVIAARVPGSLAIATSFGSAVFASICGSSLATATVFGKIAYPEMKRFKYDKSFALGSIASSGTFACMIPPSGMFILFAMFTDQSVGRLFMGGIVPGILTAVTYAASMYLRAKRTPALAPVVPEELTVRAADRARAVIDIWPILLLSGIVIGGIYSGLFTSTEAGAVGAVGALLFGIVYGNLKRGSEIRAALRESAHTTSMLFFIIVTALFFSRFLAITRIPFDLADFLQGWAVPPIVILGCIFLLWMILGMLIVQAAVFALTLPILFPVVVSLGYDPVWFCVVAMKLNEIAGVTPPVGLNAFGLAGVAGSEVKVEDVFRGIWPFVLCDLIVLVLLILFPNIVLFLPNAMM